MRAPEFWARPSPLSNLFLPLAWLYSGLGRLRWSISRPYRLDRPVICVGNAVAGGAGKTPVVLALIDLLQAKGYQVHVLSRGYGGRLKGPVKVDPLAHTHRDVGDEPLLLARNAPTWIGRNRLASAHAAIADGADVLLMDDGLQNPSLYKDLSFLVVDGGYGFGNGQVMPAGPLREPIARALGRSDAVIVIDGHREDRLGLESKPILHASIKPQTPPLTGQRIYAFAGIGRPEKFFLTLRAMGASLVGTHRFPDHHPYQDHEIHAILARARTENAIPITTEKDAIRIAPPLRSVIQTLPIGLEWRDKDQLEALLAKVMS